MFVQKKIIIDPGHGGEDPGAIGRFSQEKDINLDICEQLNDLLLQDFRFLPRLVRETDIYVHASNRSVIAVRENADVFISIHCNASISETPRDAQVFFYNPLKDKELADIIFQHISNIDGISSRWSKVEYGNFVVLRKLRDTNIPCVLIEVAFISNPDDERLLNDPDFQRKFVLGIYDGICDFFAE